MSVGSLEGYHPPTIYSNKTKCRLYIALAFYSVLFRIIGISSCLKNNQKLNRITQILNIKISHIKSILTLQKLPHQLRRHLIAETRNLPSLKTYLRANINHACMGIFNEFKKLVSARTIYINEYEDRKHHKERIEEDLKYLNHRITDINKNFLLGGVCHAMIGQVARKYLYGSNPSLASYTYEYSKGVDIEAAGLQLFLDAQGSFAWKSLTAVDSLLGITAMTIDPNDLDLSRDGLFHVAIPFDSWEKHSILFNKNATQTQILDPNFGLFEVPNSQLQDFFKNLYVFYQQQKYKPQEVRKLLSAWDETRLFGGVVGMEIRQLERITTEHRWHTLSDRLVWEPVSRSRR